MKMELWLVDRNPDLVRAWEVEFEGIPNVFIHHGDILSIAENTIVSPANSYGIMDGGIDLTYTEYFGTRPQQEIQKKIALRSEGYLPVGSAVLVETGNAKISFMISAPTILVPQQIDKANVFFAMSAILKIADLNRDKVKKIYCPGLGTGTGRVAPEDAANEMANCYKKWLTRRHT
jgi:O-acetyl-ADP-ribose deacetylase (regulator of RNase III)